MKILRKEAACQASEHEEDVEDDVEIQLIESVCDGLIDILKTLGPLGHAYFEGICEALFVYQKKSEERYRSVAVGTLAELCNAVGSAVVPYLQQLVPFAFQSMTDSDPETRNNSTFLCGVLMFHGGQQALP